MTYRISKWHEVFETAESRRHRSLRWVAFPVGFGSSGYNDLVETYGDEAPSIYGAWCALVSVAASATNRGTLANSRGVPYSLSYIAAQTRFPLDVIEELFKWAASESVGWLEVSDASGNFPGDAENLAQQPPGQRLGGDQPKAGLHNITLHNKTEPYTTGASAPVVPQPGGSDTRQPPKAGTGKPAGKTPAAKLKPPSAFSFAVKQSKQHPSQLWFLPQAELDAYAGVYADHLNVERELAKAQQWLHAHKDRRKTAVGMLKFLTAWLNRASDSTRGRDAGKSPKKVLA